LTAARTVGSAVQTKGFGSAFVSAMTDEQLDAALDALREILAAPAGEAANVIEGSAEPVALPAPEAQSPEATPEPKQKHKSNRLMREADTAVGLRERKPRSKVRSPAST
jgi:hypothetical protein